MKTNIHKKILLLLVAGVMVMGVGCSDLFDDDDDDNGAATVTKATVIANYADIVYTSYQDSLTTAQTMKTALQSLVDNPSAATLTAAKSAWLAARLPYGQTEGYRFYDGPIDDSDGPEGQLNAWPLDEAYIDYVEGNANAGIINDASGTPTITAATLKSLNEQGGDKNISTGYHAIEFLLWGQDLTVGPGAGLRTHTDYTSAVSNHDRRGQYLLLVADIIIEDLQGLVNEWDPNGDNNFRASLLAMDENAALTKMLTGAATLSKSELAGERMAAAQDARDREEEHSCFSDNTHNDIIMNAKSVQNIYLGTYTRVDGSTVSGPSFYALLKTVNDALAERIKTEMTSSITAVNAIQAPFDQEILGTSGSAEFTRVSTAVTSLRTQGDSLVSAGAEFGLSINTDI